MCHCAKCLAYIFSFNLHNNPRKDGINLFQFAAKEADLEVTCSRSNCCKWWIWDSNPVTGSAELCAYPLDYIALDSNQLLKVVFFFLEQTSHEYVLTKQANFPELKETWRSSPSFCRAKIFNSVLCILPELYIVVKSLLQWQTVHCLEHTFPGYLI